MDAGSAVCSVDYTVFVPLPSWAKGFKYPDLVTSPGYREYESDHVTVCYHQKQLLKKAISGVELYGFMRNHDKIASSLGLHDLLVLRSASFAPYADLTVFAWKGAVVDKEGDISIPYLYMDPHHNIILNWRSVSNDWHPSYPALMFP